MKFAKSIIVAALLGTISQSQLVEGVQLEHRHHHQSHHRHQPKNIGVRFVQNKDEGVSAADPSVVEGAVPESNAEEVAQEAAEAEVKKNAAKVVAIEKEAAAPVAAEAAPAVTPEEIAVAKKPESMEEYKELKADIKAQSASQTLEPAELPEEEQRAKEAKDVEALTDKADAGRHAKQAQLLEAEVANLDKEAVAAKKLLANPDDSKSKEELAEIVAQGVKNEKLKAKVQKNLAEVSAKLVVDAEKAQVRANEAAAEEVEKKAVEAEISIKKAKLAEFEDEKKEADRKLTEDFEKQLPVYVPKQANLPESKKLTEAQAKIDKLFADEEKAAEEKAAEIAAEKAEVGPNVADAAIAKAEAEFDQAKATAAAAVAPVAEKAAKTVIEAQKAEVQEYNVIKGSHGEEWVAAMPSYIVGAAPFKTLKNKPVASITAEAMHEANFGKTLA